MREFKSEEDYKPTLFDTLVLGKKSDSGLEVKMPWEMTPEEAEEQRKRLDAEYDAEEARKVPKKITCKKCGKIRYDNDERIYPEENGFFKTCGNCKKREEYEKRLEAFMLNVPKIHREDLNFNNNKSLLTERNAILYGDYGTGKSYTAYAIAKELYLNKKIERFEIVREITIINKLRSDPLSGTHYKNVDFLVIDEFGKVNDTDFTKAQIFDIIDERNDWDRKTLLICNAKDDSELNKIISDAIKDRYKNCVIKLTGESRR